MSSSRKVLNLHSVTGTFGSLMNVRFAASNVFNDLGDSIKVLCIKERISNQNSKNYGKYLVDVSSIKVRSFQCSYYLVPFILVF